MNVQKRQEIERKVVCHLIRTMKENGWIAYAVNDGEEVVKCSTETEVINNVFDVDESSIYFRKEGFEEACSAYIVLGNDGWDAIADHSYPSEGHNFVYVMDQVSEYCETLSK